jgi:hypothetical protein
MIYEALIDEVYERIFYSVVHKKDGSAEIGIIGIDGKGRVAAWSQKKKYPDKPVWIRGIKLAANGKDLLFYVKVSDFRDETNGIYLYSSDTRKVKKLVPLSAGPFAAWEVWDYSPVSRKIIWYRFGTGFNEKVIAGAVKDLAGNSLTNEYILTFTTQSLLAVVYTDPADGATDIPVDKTVYVTFSGDVQPGPNYGGIAMKAGDTVVAVTYSISGPLLTIDPVDDLNYSTAYAVYIPAGAVKDLAGNELATQYTFTFTATGQPDVTPPAVSITSPSYGSMVGPSGEVVTITANATDVVGVTKIEFYVDGVLIEEDSVAPYTYEWQSTVGNPCLSAKAYDAAGNVGTSSLVCVYVPAKVTVTYPADGSTVGGIITHFDATFSDPMKAGVPVELYIDGVYRGGCYPSAGGLSASKAYTWDTNQYANGSTHVIEIAGRTQSGSIWSNGRSTVTVHNS